MKNKALRWVLLPLIVLVVLPLAHLVLASLTGESGQALSLAAYGQLLNDPQLPKVLGNTLYISCFSTVSAVLLGTVAAVITERTDIPGCQYWRLLFLFPVLVPSYVISLAWGHWVGPVGIFTGWWKTLTGMTVWNLAGVEGITVVMTIVHIPIVFLLLRSALHAVPSQLEEAGRVSGAKPAKIFWTVTLPLLIPAIVSGALLSFASAIDNFGIPAFIGIPSGVTVLSTLIYQKVIGLGASQYEQAAALSVLTGFAAMIPVYLQARLFRGPKYRREETSQKPVSYQTGKWKWLLFLILFLWEFLTVIGPFIALFLTSLTPAYGIPLSLDNLTWKHYYSLLIDVPTVAAGLANSTMLATVTTCLVLMVSWPLAKAVVFTPTKFVKLLDALCSVPFCLPGMVVALAVLMAWIRPIPGSSFGLYGGAMILLLAYIPRFLVFGVRAWVTGWARFSPVLEEAGRIAGAGSWQVTKQILL
ncbi:MAG TPA: iron ABC transporter permease, partial [Negativicutes bacterium]